MTGDIHSYRSQTNSCYCKCSKMMNNSFLPTRHRQNIHENATKQAALLFNETTVKQESTKDPHHKIRTNTKTLYIVTLDSRQSRTLLTIDARGSKIVRNSVYNCLYRQSGDKWQSKTLFLTNFIYVRRYNVRFRLPPIQCESVERNEK